MKHFSIFLLIAIAVPKCCFAQYYEQNVSTPPLAPPDVLIPISETILWIGPMVGINFNHYQTAAFPYPDLDPPVITEQNGNGNAPMFGLSCQLPIGWANQEMIVLDFIYDYKSAAFNSGSAHNVNMQKILYDNRKGDLSTTFNASLSYFMISAGYKYNFVEAPVPRGFGVQLSLNAGFLLTNNFTKNINAVVDDSMGVEAASFSSTYQMEETHSFRMGVNGKISYDMPLNRWSNISPFIGYDLPFTKVDNTNKAWRASSYYAGIEAHFAIVVTSNYP